MASKDLKNSKELKSPEGDVLKTSDNFPSSEPADQPSVLEPELTGSVSEEIEADPSAETELPVEEEKATEVAVVAADPEEGVVEVPAENDLVTPAEEVTVVSEETEPEEEKILPLTEETAAPAEAGDIAGQPVAEEVIPQEEVEPLEEVPEAMAEVVETEAEVPEAEAEVQETEAEVQEIEAEVPEAEVPEAKAEIAELVTEVPEAMAEVVETEAEVQETEAEVQEIEAEVQETIAEITETVTEVPEAVTEVPEAEAEVPETEAEVQEIEAAIVNMEEDSPVEEMPAVAEVVDVKTTDIPVSAEEETTEEHTEDAVKSETAEFPFAAEVDVIREISQVERNADYSGLTQIELVNLLREAVDAEEDAHQVEAIVAAFYHHTREKNDELKHHFLEAGGKEEEYVSEEDPYSNDVRELLKKYRQQKLEHVKRLDAEKEANLQKKYEIIEDIKNLLNKEESINRTFHEFRELQKEWYEIGQVPQSKMKDLWDTYHFHIENFYDYIKINKELRDLDLRKNMEVKIGICEKTEELLMETSVIKAFNALQKYHEEWRETGPVPSDKKDDIWERFKAATGKINQKHQEFFEKKKVEQKKNLDAKTALCEKAEEIGTAAYETHREWDEKSRELVELQKVWKTLGFAPKKENNRIYDRFRSACDKFFINKREFYSKNKDVQQTNLQMKIDLCMEAETLKESTDWKKATQQFIDIQKRWKEIGPIPRKNSDVIWKRFRAACDYFFEKKAVHFSDIDGEQYENLRLKEKLIEDVENFKPDTDAASALRNLRDLQRRWTEIGHVPLKSKDTIQHRFRDAINKQFDALKIDNGNRTAFNFRNKIESLTDNARGLSKVRSEREKYMIKLKQLETDLTLLDNNIGFFANSKNAQALIADVNQKIVDTREKIEQLKEKIRIIDDLDKSEY